MEAKAPISLQWRLGKGRVPKCYGFLSFLFILGFILSVVVLSTESRLGGGTAPARGSRDGYPARISAPRTPNSARMSSKTMLTMCSRGHTRIQRRQLCLPHLNRHLQVQAASRESTNGFEEQDGNADQPVNRPEVENLVIIGSGPAGYTASIYAGRANLAPLVFEGYSAGGVRGGQLMSTTEVENFPGFPEGITGPDLMERMRAQAARWGATLFTEDVVTVDLSERPFTITSTERSVKANSIIIATGATAKKLGIPREDEFWSRGISACAICDGASPIFRLKPVAVVGGGDTAVEEALYLTKYASHVHLIVRDAKLRASKTMQDRLMSHPLVTVHYNKIIEDAIGDQSMTGLLLSDRKSKEQSNLNVNGLFYGIGHSPNTNIVKGQVDLNEAGYIKVSEIGQTNVEGVFAAGDIHDTEWRQAVTAAGSGCSAAIATERYLVEKDLIQEFKPSTVAESISSAHEDTIEEDNEEVFDINEIRHKGQYALRKLYHESNRVLAVMFTSPTCGPCRSLKPMLHRLLDEFENEVHFVEIDISKDSDIAEAAGVTGTPTVQFFKEKQLMDKVSGVKMKSEYRKIVSKALVEENQDSKSKVPVSENS
ncbi:hypothetical protein AAMO2058_000543800 [Amorphochlora amoebiformis]